MMPPKLPEDLVEDLGHRLADPVLSPGGTSESQPGTSSPGRPGDAAHPCHDRTGHDEELWARILRADERFYTYFADRAEVQGTVLFMAERPDAPEFDLTVIGRVTEHAAESTLAEIVRRYGALGRSPRVRLTPLSTPGRWPEILSLAGFTETDERHVYLRVPDILRPPTNPAVRIERAGSPDDADRFSAIHAAAFDLAPEHRAWDRALARRHLAVGERIFYLAWLDGRPVGAAMSTPTEDGTTLLSGLATLPDARRRGVATSLLRHRVEEARAWGSTTVFSTAREGSYPALLYERLGLEPLFVARTFVAGPDSWLGLGAAFKNLGDR